MFFCSCLMPERSTKNLQLSSVRILTWNTLRSLWFFWCCYSFWHLMYFMCYTITLKIWLQVLKLTVPKSFFKLKKPQPNPTWKKWRFWVYLYTLLLVTKSRLTSLIMPLQLTYVILTTIIVHIFTKTPVSQRLQQLF